MVLQALSTDEIPNNRLPTLGGGLIFLSSQATFLVCACGCRPLPEPLMLWCAPHQHGERKITVGCESLGCFVGIAGGCMTNKPKSLIPTLGRMDLDPYVPLHSQ